MKREDYIFTIGFDGNNAIVDKQSRIAYRKLDAYALADRGFFRAAYRSAVFDEDTAAAEYVLKKYNESSEIQYEKTDDLMKVFGVQVPSDETIGIRAI